ncbi:MAG TPA: cupin domain-containing protein, partial [Streptosporangiaceae bacterium]
MEGYFLEQTHGEVANLGLVSMRLLVAKAQTNGAVAVAEFRGAEGSWTVPHLHRGLEESFYVLEGTFGFTLGDREVEAKQGAFVLVPRGTPHIMRAGPGGGALLTLWAPGGLEEMFLELGRLPAESITDRAVRAQI